jgi:hypothetical protein
MRSYLLVIPGETRNWRAEMANGEHALDLFTTDPARLDALYWAQPDRLAEAPESAENAEIESMRRHK